MKPFKHQNASTIEGASKALASGGASLIAGGTDLLGALKDDILPDYPKTVVNLKSVEGLSYIKEEGGSLKIGSLAKIADIAEDPIVNEHYRALAQAASSVATPHIRDMGTIGGNLAQLNRCWYFRKPGNQFYCLRKGGKECFALTGDNRYHSIFGGSKVSITPCSAECPAGTDIPGYMAEIRKGDWDQAAEILLKANPLPSITSRVCAHPCQGRCNQCEAGEAVAISSVERALGDYALDRPEQFYKPPAIETGRSAAIIGSGPAGLSAAYFLRKAGVSVTVFESKPEFGGMLMYAIPPYRLPKDIVKKAVAALKGMGIKFIFETTVGKSISADELEKSFDAVCYATGAWKRPVVGISGEELTVFGLDFLSEAGRWMEGKAGEDVIVAGGGNVAMDVAVTAKRLGAKSVTLACLEPRDKMPASAEEIARAEAEGVDILTSWGLSRVIEEGGKAAGLELKRCLSPWDESGAFNPVYDEGDIAFVNASNILMATGQGVDLSFLSERYQLQLTPRGFIDIAADSQMTSREGVFATGDATTGTLTVIGAIAGGRRMAVGVGRLLGAAGEPSFETGGYLTFDPIGIASREALKLRELDKEKRSLGLEDSFSPTIEEAAGEASRCLNCGCYSVNPSDLAPALAALSAKVHTTSRIIPIESFFDVKAPSGTSLLPGEIIREIEIPRPLEGSKSSFAKMAFRKSIDFAIVSCAISIGGKSPKICLNAVAPKPYRARQAEAFLIGKEITPELAEEAGSLAVAEAAPFEATRYKAQIAKTLVKRALIEFNGLKA